MLSSHVTVLALTLAVVGEDAVEPCELLATPERAAELRADLAWLEAVGPALEQLAVMHVATVADAGEHTARDWRMRGVEPAQAIDDPFEVVRYGQPMRSTRMDQPTALAAAGAPLVVWLLDAGLEDEACSEPVADVVARDALELVRTDDALAFVDPSVRALASVGWMPLAAFRAGAFHEWLGGLRDGTSLAPRLDEARDTFDPLDKAAWGTAIGKLQALLALGRPDAALAFTQRVWVGSRHQVSAANARHTVGLVMWDLLRDAGVEGSEAALRQRYDDLLARVDDLRAVPVSNECQEFLVLLRRFERVDDLDAWMDQHGMPHGLVVLADQVFDLLADAGHYTNAAWAVRDLARFTDRRVLTMSRQLAAAEAGRSEIPIPEALDAYLEQAVRLLRVSRRAALPEQTLQLARTLVDRVRGHPRAAVALAQTLAEERLPVDDVRAVAQGLLDRDRGELRIRQLAALRQLAETGR